MNLLRFLRVAAIVSVWLAVSTVATAALRLADYYGDNMLFLRDRPMVLNGWADAQQAIQVCDDRQCVTGTADADGRWRIALPPRAAERSIEIRVDGDGGSVTLRNVAVGELWFASGQSNMGWPMSFIAARADDIDSARNPQLRIMSVQQRPAIEPEDDLSGHWYPATPDSVRDYSALGYHFGNSLQRALGVPVGVIVAAWGGSRIGPWMPADVFEQVAPPQLRGKRSLHGHPWAPSALYNGMVHALGELPIRGILWYQGESSLNDGRWYLPKLRLLIESWRKRWNDAALPFYYAQIAPLDYSGCCGVGENADMLPQFWQMQLDALRIPATGIVPTLDLNPQRMLHPTQKREVGERFAALALSRLYGRSLIADAPRYSSHRIVGGALHIDWDAAQGLHAADGKPLRGFELAGADGRFRPASARIEGASVVVTAPGVGQPKVVRYAWQALPDTNLVNAAGLPALPFRAPQ